MHQPKRWEYSNKDGDKSPNTLNDKEIPIELLTFYLNNLHIKYIGALKCLLLNDKK